MSDRGVYAVDRGVWDHPMFAPEPFSEREAWLWLVGQAAWKAIRVRVGRNPIQVIRGQCAFALRFLASKWKWSEPRVRRFLKRLKTDAMVLVSATRDATLITICNYEKYAFSRRASEVETDAQTDEPATHKRRKEEEGKEVKKERQKEEGSELRSAAEQERELFQRGKQVLGPSAGGLIANLLKSKERDIALARAAVETASTKQNPTEYIIAVTKGNGNGRYQRPLEASGGNGLKGALARMRETEERLRESATSPGGPEPPRLLSNGGR